MRGRVRLHKEAMRQAEAGRPLPECTPEERWQRPTTWAVMKPGRKRALRVFEERAPAEALAEEHQGARVEERPGASVRCLDYCPVRDFCDQWKKMNGGE